MGMGGEYHNHVHCMGYHTKYAVYHVFFFLFFFFFSFFFFSFNLDAIAYMVMGSNQVDGSRLELRFDTKYVYVCELYVWLHVLSDVRVEQAASIVLVASN